MATTSSQQITDLDASPIRFESRLVLSGSVKTATQTISIPSAAAAADIFLMIRLPVRAHIISLLSGWDDLDTTTNVTIDIGAYRTVPDGGAVIDVDAFTATPISGQAERLMLETRFLGAATGLETVEQPLWQLLGVPAEPEYSKVDIAFTLAAGPTTTTGDASLSITYTDGN